MRAAVCMRVHACAHVYVCRVRVQCTCVSLCMRGLYARCLSCGASTINTARPIFMHGSLWPARHNQTQTSKRSLLAGQYKWTNDDRGKVLSAFFYGYCSLQYPGGYLASRFGGKPLMIVVVLGSAVIHAAVPFAPQHSSVFWVSLARVGTGLVQGPLYPTWAALVSEWLEPEERGMASG